MSRLRGRAGSYLVDKAVRSWLERSYCGAGDTASEVQAKLESLVDELALDWFAYAMLRPPGGRTADIGATALTNFPPEFVDRFLRRRYQALDPVCDRAVGSIRPFYWGRGRFLRAFRQQQRRVFDEASAFGIVSGLAIPVHGTDGAVGVLAVSADNAKRLQDAVAGEHERLFAAAYDAHEFALGASAGAPESEPPEPRLTVRERECLLWTAEGKTADDVAALLGLSVSTVNHHVSAAARKLGCLNKHHAVVRALRAGLI